MISAMVFLIFFFLLAFSITAKSYTTRFSAIICGLLFFPHVIAFRNSPYIAPQTLLLYLPLVNEFLKHPSDYITAIRKFPLKIPLIIFLLTSTITALHISGSAGKNVYDMLRYAIDTYAFFFLAYWFGLHLSPKKFFLSIFPALIVFCVFGIVEFLLGANYPYKYICSSFPIYQGIYDLNSSISLSQSWRSRICITTHHPNTLTPMLLSLIFLLIPNIKKLPSKFLILCGFMAVLIPIAGSRTGIFLLCGLASLYWIKKLPLLAKLTIAFACFSFVVYGAYSIYNYFDSGNGSSITMRLNQFAFAVLLFLRDPIYGNGTGFMAESIFEIDAYGEKQLVDKSIGALESFFFRVLIDYGIIGIAAQVIIILFLLFYFFTKREKIKSAVCGLYITLSLYAFVLLSGDSNGTFRFVFCMIGLCLGNCVFVGLDKETQDSLEFEGKADFYLDNEDNRSRSRSEAHASL